MSLKVLAVSLVAVCVCSVVVALTILNSPARQTGSEGPPFAYITQRQLVLMRGDRAVSRVPRFFEETDSAQNRVVWTNNGLFIALLKNVALLQEAPSREELITISARTGKVQHLPCPGCYDLTPVGKSAVLVAANATNNNTGLDFSEFNLASGRPGRPVHLNLPDSGTSERFFLASTQKHVITQQGTFATGDYAQQLELTSLHGQPGTSLGYFTSNEYMLAAAAENANDTSDQIAVAFRPNPGECVSQFPVLVFDARDGMLNTDMSAAEPRGHRVGVDEGLQVNDLWWGIDGHFHATITSWTCDNSQRAENDKQILASPSATWKLDGHKWVRERDAITAVTMARQLSDHTWIGLVIPDCVGPKNHPDPAHYCNTGTLYRYQDGKRAILAKGVLSISAPSPRYFPRLPSGQSPTLGRLAGLFVHGKGFGQVKPSEVFNGGDPTGLVTHVSWKSWGEPSAVGKGTGEYIGPNQSASRATQEPVTIVAFNRGNCNGQTMYRAVEWYFPQHGQTFNPHQYEDICTGAYVGTP